MGVNGSKSDQKNPNQTENRGGGASRLRSALARQGVEGEDRRRSEARSRRPEVGARGEGEGHPDVLGPLQQHLRPCSHWDKLALKMRVATILKRDKWHRFFA